MGGSSSKEEKNTENSGAVQNNIHVNNKPMEVHNSENTILLGIICTIKLLEMVIYIYKSFRRSLKKNLANNPNVQAAQP